MKQLVGKVALGYHVCAGDMLARGDKRKIVEGKVYEARKSGKPAKPHEVSLCGIGMHASPTPYDALTAGGPGFMQADVISYVLLRGITYHGERSTGFHGGGQKLAGFSREHLVVRKLNLEHRLHLAYLMGGGGRANTTQEEIKSTVNSYLLSILGRPEAVFTN